MRSPRLALTALLLTAASGCVFYADDDDDCLYGGAGDGDGAAEPAYDPGLRNPQTGQCEYWGGGGGGGCGDPCNPCPAAEEEDRAPTPTWGLCESQCTGLDEATCSATGGCRAIYTSACIDRECYDEPLYVDCWATDMTGPVQGGGCDGLDAYACSLHDDCAAVHHPDCGDSAGGDGAEAPAACLAGAFGYCMAEGDETDPGNCYEPVTCDAATPECPEGTTPGIRNGCYTGYCIPLEECEDQPACSAIEAEASCIARADCSPIYRGEDCSCQETVCDCATWVWESCK